MVLARAIHDARRPPQRLSATGNPAAFRLRPTVAHKRYFHETRARSHRLSTNDRIEPVVSAVRGRLVGAGRSRDPARVARIVESGASASAQRCPERSRATRPPAKQRLTPVRDQEIPPTTEDRSHRCATTAMTAKALRAG